MIGMMRLQTSLILSHRSWEIGNPPTGGVGWMKLPCQHRSLYILKKDLPPHCEHCQCILTVHHILVECNHFAQAREDTFRFHRILL